MKGLIMVSKGGYVRRTAEGLVPIHRNYIQKLIDNVDVTHYDRNLKDRNKALIALTYLSGRRISELCGRILKDKISGVVVDVSEGVKRKDFRFDTLDNQPIVIMHCRILKKGRILDPKTRLPKTRLPKVWKDIIMLRQDPFMKYVLEWRNKCGTSNAKLFNIKRSRAYQIIHELDADVWLHWLRHQRFSHLAKTMNPYQLREFAFWSSLEPAMSYIHAEPGATITAIQKADKAWE